MSATVDAVTGEPASAACDQIAEALAQAAATIANPPRNRTVTVTTKAGGKYTYSYSTLDAVLDEVRPKLAAVGIALLQPVIYRDGRPYLVTRLLHKSGQSIEHELPLIGADGDGRLEGAQAFGSALTYMRRYGIESLLPIAAEHDDDGAAASGREVAEKTDQAACPKCGKNSKVIPSKFRPGELYCLACKAGFAPVSPEPDGDPEGDREPGSDDDKPLGHGEHDFEPLAKIPAEGSPDRRSVTALGQELLRLTGDKPSSMALLSELCGAATLRGMPPQEVAAAWAALAKHPKWGRP